MFRGVGVLTSEEPLIFPVFIFTRQIFPVFIFWQASHVVEGHGASEPREHPLALTNRTLGKGLQ